MAKSLSIYLMTLAAFVAALIAVFRAAGSYPSPVATAVAGSPFASILTTLHAPLSQLLMQVVLIVVVARVVGATFTRFGQPAVIGEMFAGLALGPSLFGAILPVASAFVFPTDKAATANLGMLSQVGILLFMFVVGMELDTSILRKQAHSAVLISHTSIALPFILGLTAALWLFRGYAGEHSSFLAFALFMGISMSITAFPVLARIIQERGIVGTELGATAVTCAAVDDITAWSALAFIVALSKAQSLAGAGLTVALALSFVAVMFLVVRPALGRTVALLPNPGRPGKNVFVVALLTVFASALMTEAIGIHALFGAFLAGVVMPAQIDFRTFLRERLEYFSTLFLLPIFFAFTGLRTQVGLLNTGTDWLVCAALLGLAVLGKFGGSALAARATGMSWRDSAGMGALMNTRGLMELIALNLGLDLGVLSPKIFAMLVMMALITTFSTGPVLHLLKIGHMVEGGRRIRGDEAPA